MIKSIRGFPKYSISDKGEVFSRHKKLKLHPTLTKYLQVCLYQNRKASHKLVHRLVLETFIGPCPEKMECCHNNGIRTDNRLENLRWDTRSNNHKDAIKKGTHVCLWRGEKVPTSKLKESDVRMIIYMWRTKEFSQKEIMNLYQISRGHVYLIVHKKTWKHIWGD